MNRDSTRGIIKVLHACDAAVYFFILCVLFNALNKDEPHSRCDFRCSPPIVRWSPDARQEMSQSPSHCLGCDVLVIAIGPSATGKYLTRYRLVVMMINLPVIRDSVIRLSMNHNFALLK